MISIKYLFLFYIVFSVGILLKAQQSDPDFEKFAKNQAGLFKSAYLKKDCQTLEILLNEFLLKYNKLDAAKKIIFKTNLHSAFFDLCRIYSEKNDKNRALENLEKSIKYGKTDYNKIMSDSSLINIKAEKKFQELLSSIRPIGDYIYILKKARTYNYNDNRILPEFTYKAINDSGSITLRKKFKLDSIAGNGDEITKILNLMHWLHNLISHESNGLIPTSTVIELINICKTDKLGLNCAGLSSILNECYTALGIKSRILLCLPKDSLGSDFDYHVINMTFSNTFKKWLWIDPTNDAYVMNEKDELLSVEEVREKIINNKFMKINQDARYNGLPVNINDYLYSYMAKNLYKFESPVVNDYSVLNYLSSKTAKMMQLLPSLQYLKKNSNEYKLFSLIAGKTSKTIQLLPMDCFTQNKDIEEIKILTGKIIYYKTNNPALFWKEP
jgi:hypothetical protein